ncbi:NAD(P)/FAD-dependent oxidoreductase [Tistrella mobilis]|uniref:NAD(P)/FAD-dependent oxidoreductase n=1 Tax=Tistrella mobilis TaxID=171437 RepID=UPI00355918FD
MTAEHWDVVVIGAGPAGLAAATELRRQSVDRVLVLDREAEAGGIPRHCAHSPFGLREFRRLLTGPAYARRLVGTAAAAGVAIRTRTTVVAIRPGSAPGSGPELDVSTPEAGLGVIRARRVLVATGVRETSRAQRLIGGTKPGGVLSTGALQGLVHLDHLKPFSRPVVLGTELVSFSALITCIQADIRPVAMIEPGQGTVARWPAALLPRLLGVKLLTGTGLRTIEGRDRVTAVTLRDADGAERVIETDGVVVTGGFRPEATLFAGSHLERDPRTGGPVIDEFGRCSDPTVFAAGNLLRPVETAGWSWREGRRTGRAIALDLAGRLPAAGGLAVVVAGAPLCFALPQLIAGGRPGLRVHDHIQFRVDSRVAGRLVLTDDGREIWSQRLRSRPERRILVPIDALPAVRSGRYTFGWDAR